MVDVFGVFIEGTECHKDIIFVIDDSNAMRTTFPYVKSLVNHLVDEVPIGRRSSLSIYAFSTRLSLNLYFPEGSTGKSIKNIVTSLRPSFGFPQAINTLGIQLVNEWTIQHSRRGVPNAVVFISASNYRAPQDNQFLSTAIPLLRITHHNVISIGIGYVDPIFMSLIASDRNHNMHINSPQQLADPRNINKIYKLICD